IGHLDAAVLCGYPGTIASAWQQIGRAGRRRSAAAAIYVASSSPLDQYLVNHPEYFLGRDPEQGLIDPDNLLILSAHLQAATFELPLPAGEPFGAAPVADRKSTRLNSSHVAISYAVFCLKKKTGPDKLVRDSSTT